LKEDGKSLEKMIKQKALIIGCGKISGLYDDKEDDYIYSHAKAYAKNNSIDLVCCCDLNIDNAKTLSQKYNIPNISDNFLEAIKLYSPDVVSVCTPDNTHYEVVVSILKCEYLPQVIFLEKPACQNEDELNELISLSREKDVKIIVNHSRRFDSLHQQLKNEIENNKFGKLIKADAVYYSGWQHNGVHIVDTLNFLFSDTLEFEQLLNTTNSPYENDYNLDFKCQFKNSDALVYITTMDEKYYQLFEFDFKFEKARIRLEDFGQRISYEEKEINSMNENILVKKDFQTTVDNTTPMQSAISEIVAFLEYNKVLKGYLIEDISQTMKTIWKGQTWVK
jgi:predicted dehydrogenase